MINLLIVGSILCLFIGYVIIVVLVDAAPVVTSDQQAEQDHTSPVEYYPRLIWSPPSGQDYDEAQAVATLSQTLVEDLYYDETLQRDQGIP